MTALSGLYVITDPQLLPPAQLMPACAAALAGGARILQYRDKPASAEQRLRRARDLRDLTREHGALLIINDDLELALRCHADGVHLGQGDGNAADARRRLGPDAILGVTCHDRLDLARNAADQGASYVAFGRFFPSHTKPQAPPASIDILTAAQPLGLPRVAIGGVNADNGAHLIAAGAEMLAVIHAVFGAPNIEAAARRLAALFFPSPR
ncbi:thiamine phosphate synthase [Isoalcanivorax beigongshangi]|uniref:Thiamine-phosphate synthase n=1 Tax=Isoalcanivorax beigongshangi TaxID=3238810 RepID=A0ABV4AMZ6_9GAMM